MVHVQGLLTPACGAALRTAIDAWSAPQPDERTALPTRAPPPNAATTHCSGSPSSAIATPGQLPSTHGSPYRIVVTVPHDTLTAASRGPVPSPAWRRRPCPTAPHCPRPRSPRLTCDADLVADPDGPRSATPSTSATTQRLFPPKQRTAIAHRDQHCTYPGCPPHRPGATPTTSSRSARRPHRRQQRRAPVRTPPPPRPRHRPDRPPHRRPGPLGHRPTGQATPAAASPAPPGSLDDLTRRWRAAAAEAAATARRSSGVRAAGSGRPRRRTPRSRR